MTGVVGAAAGRDALAGVIAEHYEATPDHIADAVLASSWLEGMLAAERERVAVAIEAAGRRPPRHPQWMWAVDAAVAARIARAAVSAPTGGGVL